MKTISFTVLFASLSLLCATGAQARNEPSFLPIQDALKTNEAQSKLRGEIQFYFGDQPYPAVGAMLSQGLVAYKKGSIFELGAEVATCNRTLLAALLQLQAHARKMGGNAVVNIESYYQKISFKSNDQFECRVGNAKTGVMLRGDVVRLGN